MKLNIFKNHSFHLFILLFAFFALSCSSEDTLNTSSSVGEFSVDVNGQTIAFKNVFAIINEDDTDDFNGIGFVGTDLSLDRSVALSITTSNSIDYTDGLELQFSENDIFSNDRIGILTYTTVSDFTIDASAFGSENGSFNVKFTELDYRVGGKCKGTLSGVLIDEESEEVYNLTNGTFNLVII